MNKNLLLMLFVFIFIKTFSQDNCTTAVPFCDNFGSPATVVNNNTADPGPNYGCLTTQPNPSWSILKIETAGVLDLQIQQTASNGIGIDVDYICYGPFNDPTAPCQTGALTAANTIDCSYSPDAIENLTIPNAQVGEYYFILITNFGAQEGTLIFSQTNVGQPGAGSSDCSIVCNIETIADETLCIGNSITLTTTIGNPNIDATASYKWFKNNVEIVGETNNELIVTTNTVSIGTYKVTLNAPDCQDESFDEVTLTFVDVFANFIQTPISTLVNCDIDFNNDGISNFNLTDNETLIANLENPLDYTFSYFEDAGLLNQIPNATITNYNNTLSYNQTIYVSATHNTFIGCNAVYNFDLIVFDTPVANPVIDWFECDDNTDGFLSWDLSSLTNTVLGAQNAGDFLVSYHNSQADADTNTNPLPLNYTNTIANELKTIFVRIENNANTDCYSTTSFNLQVIINPIINTLNDYNACDDDNDGFFEFDLTTLNSDILIGLNPANYTITYHNNINDAIANNNAYPNLYTNINAYTPETVFIRLEHNLNTTCPEINSFTIRVYDTPIANPVDNWFACDDNIDGILSWDFSTLNSTILGNQNAANSTITYHNSQADANTNSNPLPINYTNTVPNELKPIFVRIENNTNSNCFNTTSFTIQVIVNPTVGTVTDWVICDNDNDGFYDFDFTTLYNTILNGQNPTDYTISFHPNFIDATNDVNSLASNYTNANAFTEEPIFVRVENNLNTTCPAITTFNIHVFKTPIANSITNWYQCDDNQDGFKIFDLSTRNSQIIANQDPSEFTINYYISQLDADNNTNPIALNYTNTTAFTQEELFVRIENTLIATCFDTISFFINVMETPIANPVQNMIICDDDNDGYAVFDFETIVTPQILNGQDATNFSISYHLNPVFANNNLHAIDLQYTNSMAFDEQTIYARIENNLYAACYQTTSFTIKTVKTPEFDVEEIKYICVNLLPQTVVFEVTNPLDNYTYSWKDDTALELSTSTIFNATQPGNYTLTVTTTDGNFCETIKNIQLLPAEPATITNIIINEYWAEENFSITLEIEGTGVYQYAIDDINGPYQDDPYFINVPPGIHTVYVNEINNCGSISKQIDLFGYAAYFSPNDDGFHDIWKVQAIYFKPNAKIYIFDRFGKVMTQFLPANNEGWDGNYLGKPAPEGDYWFTADMVDYNGKPIIRKGHFSLVRTKINN